MIFFFILASFLYGGGRRHHTAVCERVRMGNILHGSWVISYKFCSGHWRPRKHSKELREGMYLCTIRGIWNTQDESNEKREQRNRNSTNIRENNETINSAYIYCVYCISYTRYEVYFKIRAISWQRYKSVRWPVRREPQQSLLLLHALNCILCIFMQCNAAAIGKKNMCDVNQHANTHEDIAPTSVMLCMYVYIQSPIWCVMLTITALLSGLM